ncbi:Flagellin protein FlaB [hydrothermal vent metagenome]|uniref:Flagellin protein FlaB n=1 Tax=hydrothermal vent metagenome TaxID=652676 RepID=A0A3B1AJQ8_9ZZZZ
MPQIINTNIMSLNSQRHLNRSQDALQTSLQRLSSGLRINSAKDDAAGLAISERFTAQIRGLNQAIRNSNDGISLAQTAEGALSESGNILQRIRELSVQSANATNSASDRQALQAEVGQLVSELERIAVNTEFNGQKILDGTFGAAIFQVGANANQTIQATTSNFRTEQFGNYRIEGAGNSTGGAGRITGETINLNGHLGSSAIALSPSMSAQEVSELINAQTSNTGISSFAKTDIDMSFAAAGGFAFTVEGNGGITEEIAFTITETSGNDGLSAVVTAFNDISSKTGVTAKVNDDGSGVTLTHLTGGNISLTANANNLTAVNVGTSSLGANSTVVTTGQLTFDSDKSFGVTGQANQSVTLASEAAFLMSISEMDISTVEGANRTLAIVDAGLNTVNGQRAQFGAIQSRFESTIANLATNAENLSAARSRIRDTDFAMETAELTRAQILQQAGTAMLAQANVQPQNVLSLLQ